MVDRWTVEKAVRMSTLAPCGRHLLLTLLTWADNDTAIIPARFTPSLTALARATGYARSTVARWLNLLEAAGWVFRARPSIADARRRKTRTQYRLAVPAGVDLAEGAPAAQPAEPGRAADGPPNGPAQPGAGPTPGTETGREPSTTGVAGGHQQGSTPAGPASTGQAQRDEPRGDHRYVEGPNGYCAVTGCARSAPLHGRQARGVAQVRHDGQRR